MLLILANQEPELAFLLSLFSMSNLQ